MIRSICLVLIVSFALSQALPSKKLPRENEGHIQDELGFYVVDWKTDGLTITFNISAQTTGYVGFGISPTPNMQGADIFIGGVNADGTSYAGDYYAAFHETPTLDDQQDWELNYARENETHTEYSVTRPVIANEEYPPDMDIPEGFANVIWAFGETDNIEFHGFENIGIFNVTLL